MSSQILKDRNNCRNFAHTKTRNHESILFTNLAYGFAIIIV